tara:strand:+ start:5769 stop:7130 length:1362 start_codon:yes stop_codon:yes gene_type:complete
MENQMHNRLTDEQLIRYFCQVVSDNGFLAPVALRLTVMTASEWKGRPIKAAATDGTYLWFNPDWAANLTPAEIMGVILHEIWHVAAGHPWRGRGYPPNKSNIAKDHEVNGICLESGATLPGSRIWNPKYKDWKWERVYEDLFGEEDDDGVTPEPPEGPDQGDEGDQGDEPEQGGLEGGQQEGQPEEQVSDQQDQADGEPNNSASTEESDVEGPEWGEVWEATNEDGTPLTEEECQEALGELAEEIIRGETEQLRAGNQKGYGGNAVIDRVMRPKAHWMKRISALVKRTGKVVGSTYRRPSRRTMATGVISAHKIKSSIDEIVIAVDVSYSVDMRRLRAFFDHLDRLRDTVFIKKIHIVPFTTVASNDAVQVVKHGQKLPRKFQIGGGTAFAPIFNWQRRYAKRAEMVIVFTDLGSNDYGDKPKCPVLWASSDPINHYNKPPFGTAVEIEINGG